MCLPTTLTVTRIIGSRAIMSDGRTVLLGTVGGVHAGDRLTVIANVAIERSGVKKERRKGKD